MPGDAMTSIGDVFFEDFFLTSLVSAVFCGTGVLIFDVDRIPVNDIVGDTGSEVVGDMTADTMGDFTTAGPGELRRCSSPASAAIPCSLGDMNPGDPGADGISSMDLVSVGFLGDLKTSKNIFFLMM